MDERFVYMDVWMCLRRTGEGKWTISLTASRTVSSRKEKVAFCSTDGLRVELVAGFTVL